MRRVGDRYILDSCCSDCFLGFFLNDFFAFFEFVVYFCRFFGGNRSGDVCEGRKPDLCGRLVVGHNREAAGGGV